MYCPKCKSEFRKGFFECSDCLVPLVEKLPPEEPKPTITLECIEFKKIKKNTDMGDIAIIKSILDDHQIIYSQNQLCPKIAGCVSLLSRK